MDMENVFQDFSKLFEERFRRNSIVGISEDALRYDFFNAASKIFKLRSWEIQVEYPFPEETYHSLKNTRSRRKENPKVDMSFTIGMVRNYFEFGLFKRNGNMDGQINATARIYKMLNDFMRLSTLKRFDPDSKAFFICVADQKILGHKLQNEEIHKFPAKVYSVSGDILDKFSKTKTGKKNIDEKFLRKLKQLEISIKARLIYEHELTPGINELETRILVWEIN
jgi:hypothetical protein